MTHEPAQEKIDWKKKADEIEDLIRAEMYHKETLEEAIKLANEKEEYYKIQKYEQSDRELERRGIINEARYQRHRFVNELFDTVEKIRTMQDQLKEFTARNESEEKELKDGLEEASKNIHALVKEAEGMVDDDSAAEELRDRLHDLLTTWKNQRLSKANKLEGESLVAYYKDLKNEVEMARRSSMRPA